jgi:hypothetical protein
MHTADSQAADELLNEGIVSNSDVPQGREAAFQQALDEYEISGDGLKAALSFAVSDLLDIAGVIGGALKQSLHSAEDKLDHVKQINGPMGELFRIHRQVDRFINIGLRAEELRAKATLSDDSPRNRRLSSARLRPKGIQQPRRLQER